MLLLLVAANHEGTVTDLIVDTNFQTKIAIKMNILNNEVGIRLQRDSLKKVSAVLIVDTVEYVVAAVTIEPTVKTLMANIALLNDLVQFEFEGELLRMMSLTMIVNNTPVKLINVEMATDFLKLLMSPCISLNQIEYV